MRETSLLAYESIQRFLSPLRRRVYEYVVKHGPIADHDLATQMDLQIRTAGPRRIELTQAGMLRDSGKRTKTPSGNDAILWEANPDATVAQVEAFVAEQAAKKKLPDDLRAGIAGLLVQIPDGPSLAKAYRAVRRIFDKLEPEPDDGDPYSLWT